MARLPPQWTQLGSYAGSVDRQLVRALWPTAASSGCAVSAVGGMAVEIAPGQVAVPASDGTTVLCTSTAVETVTLTPAPPSGSDRVDFVVCEARSADFGGTTEDFIFTYVTGPEAPTGTAPRPALPANAVKLAEVTVHGGSAAINPAYLIDFRPFALAVGAPPNRPRPIPPSTPWPTPAGKCGWPRSG